MHPPGCAAAGSQACLAGRIAPCRAARPGGQIVEAGAMEGRRRMGREAAAAQPAGSSLAGLPFDPSRLTTHLYSPETRPAGCWPPTGPPAAAGGSPCAAGAWAPCCCCCCCNGSAAVPSMPFAVAGVYRQAARLQEAAGSPMAGWECGKTRLMPGRCKSARSDRSFGKNSQTMPGGGGGAAERWCAHSLNWTG